MIVIFIFLGFAGVALILLVVRNDWVLNKRIAVLEASQWDGTQHVEFKSLPSYNFMLYHFWVWDVKRFLPKECRDIKL